MIQFHHWDVLKCYFLQWNIIKSLSFNKNGLFYYFSESYWLAACLKLLSSSIAKKFFFFALLLLLGFHLNLTDTFFLGNSCLLILSNFTRRIFISGIPNHSLPSSQQQQQLILLLSKISLVWKWNQFKFPGKREREAKSQKCEMPISSLKFKKYGAKLWYKIGRLCASIMGWNPQICVTFIFTKVIYAFIR